MKKFIRYSFITCLSIILFSTFFGCGSVMLSDVEQMVYDYAKEFDSASSKVELDTVMIYSFKDGVDSNLKFDSGPRTGQYILLTGVVLWDNGAKDEFYYKYKLEDGKVDRINLLEEFSGSGSSFSNSIAKYNKDIFDIEMLYYKYLKASNMTISLDEFKDGELGYVPIDQESLDRINKVLAIK